jgi:predicted nucleotidyltransferase
MIALVADNKEEIIALCKKHGVVRLELFGSAATGKFNPETSDLDFIVDFGDYESGVAVRFFEFVTEMEELFGRHVDLLTDKSITNPYLRISVDRSRELVYEAADSKAAA